MDEGKEAVGMITKVLQAVLVPNVQTQLQTIKYIGCVKRGWHCQIMI